jgi:hypothetical protein
LNFTSFADSYIFHQSPTTTSQLVKRVTNSKTAQNIRWLGDLTRLDQSWSIFAPNPPRDDGWHVILGTIKNGERVNLLREDAVISWDKPTIKQRNKLYKNMQWRTYFINLNRNIGKQLYPHYGNYLCQQWNNNHSPSQQLENIEIYFMSERTAPLNELQTVTKERHWQQSCS